MGRFSITVLATMLLFVLFGCENDTKTEQIKDLVCNVTSTNVTTNGGNDGSITITVVTGNGEYDYYNNNQLDANRDGKFENLIAGTYNIKVTDSKGKEFTKSVTITQPSLPPSVETGTSTVISISDVTLNGKVNPNGYITTSVYFEYGTTNSYGTKINLSNINGNTLTPVSIKITNGLTPNTIYHYRLVATNEGGTTYGNDSIFNTYSKPVIKSVSTSDVTYTSATLNCDINPQGSQTKFYFEYGTTTSYGNKTIDYYRDGTSDISIGITIIDLTPNTIYHYRLVATNAGGTTIINDNIFTTLTYVAPTVSNLSESNITSTGVTINADINTGGSSTNVYVKYGTSAGSLTNTSSTITLTNSTTVSINLTGLTPNTLYYYKVLASNGGGFVSSGLYSFTTSVPTYNIGDELYGGVIFYVDGTGQHGKIVQKTDETNAMNWTTASVGVTRNGKLWNLPTWDEIKLVYDNRTQLNFTYLNTNYSYWTNTDVSYSYAARFFAPNLKYSELKTEEYLIRYITTF